MVAQVCSLEVGEFIWTGGDVHLYKNHLDQVKEQLSREPFPDLPVLQLNPEIENIDDFCFSDIKITGYSSHPSISAPIAI